VFLPVLFFFRRHRARSTQQFAARHFFLGWPFPTSNALTFSPMLLGPVLARESEPPSRRNLFAISAGTTIGSSNGLWLVVGGCRVVLGVLGGGLLLGYLLGLHHPSALAAAVTVGRRCWGGVLGGCVQSASGGIFSRSVWLAEGLSWGGFSAASTAFYASGKVGISAGLPGCSPTGLLIHGRVGWWESFSRGGLHRSLGLFVAHRDRGYADRLCAQPPDGGSEQKTTRQDQCPRWLRFIPHRTGDLPPP